MAGYLPSVGSRSGDGYFGGDLVVGERVGIADESEFEWVE
jgi:hypothetical protein